MTKNYAELIQGINQGIPDNNTGLVSPADVRQNMIDLADWANELPDIENVKGAYNVSTNIPMLTATPDPTFNDGAYYDITVSGVVSFAGANFTSGTVLNIGDKLKKKGTLWYRIPFVIADSSITTDKIANNAVTLDKIDDTVKSKLITNTERRKVALVKSRYPKHGYFTDSQGYVVFHFDDTGTDSFSYRIIDPVTKLAVGTLDKSWFTALNTKINSIPDFKKLLIGYRKDGVYVTDALGNVISKTTSAGLQAIKFLNKSGLEIGNRKLEGKFAYSLGDSHSLAKWTDEFSLQTGCSFDTAIQATVRANSTNYPDTALMLGEAKALKAYCTANNKNIDLIIVENVHYSKEGVISDWTPMNYENLATWGSTYASYTDYSNNINADKASLIASTTPKLRTALRFPYNNYKETITFSGSSLTAGTATLTINGFNFPITVTAGMTLSQAVTKLNDWAFEEYLVTWSNASTKGLTRTNTIELVYKGTSSSPAQPAISFSAGTTGMAMTGYAQSSTTSFQDFYFNSLLLSDWNNSTKWVATNGTSVYPSVMGLLEYLQVNFPSTEIITYLVPNTQVSSNPSDSNSFVKETFSGSGVYIANMQAYQSDANTIKYRNSQLAIKEISERYNIRNFDIETKCGISLVNMFTGGYYISNDVHPTEKGYRQWGATLAKLY